MIPTRNRDGPTIDYYFSVFSDWAYFAGERLEHRARRYGARVVHKSIKLTEIYARRGGILLQNRSKPAKIIGLLSWSIGATDLEPRFPYILSSIQPTAH